MKMFKNKDNCLLIVGMGIIILCFSLFTYFYTSDIKKLVNREINTAINNVLNQVVLKYPEVSEEELIKLLNSKEEQMEQIPYKAYGINVNDVSVIEQLNIMSLNATKIQMASLILLFISIFIIIVIFIQKRTKKIDELTTLISHINQKIYTLDITKNNEDELSNLRNELYKTAITLKSEALSTSKVNKAIRESVANISHQLKTPLTSVSVLIDNIIFDAKMEDVTRKKFLKDIRHQIQNINFFIMTMLKLSRLDAGVVEFKKENIYVSQILNLAIKNLNVIMDIKNVTIDISGDDDVSFMGDPVWELEAISNIIKNCIEYSENDSHIDISFSQNPLFTKIVIKDYGKGMNKKELNNIFKRFYKGENSNESSFGIGLSLAKEIIENDSGLVKVTSEEKNGTIFTIKYKK